jgi:hypothetical protein
VWDGQPIIFAESSFEWSKEPFWLEPVPKEEEAVVKGALKQLTKQLQDKKWELLGEGAEWYSLKFRRHPT